ncbi:type II secretion system protein N [Simiduia sp. 21SJ11W-1]|uniref:type II secretion system protein N n=1 Tax=Simiduia sp. 21SJ11W-1 TaxID=2909669 RepID=UPI00209E64CC|nr:type II secretion system protein N [Simiduia sp. 21SJ11W-1]UTA47876.1 type II secretion system protein N [Simiduia sp. 21SJ11W-1]
MSSEPKHPLSYWRWSLAGLCLLLAWIISMAPASLMANAAAAGGLQLQGVTGSFWAGSAESARLQLAPYRGRQLVFDLGELDWSLKPSALLGMRACAQLQSSLNAQQITGRVCQGLTGGTEFNDIRVNLPANFLSLVAPVDATGQLMLAIDELQLVGNRIEAVQGSGRINQLAVEMDGRWLQFGNMDLQLEGAGGGPFSASVISEDQAIQWRAQSGALNLGRAGLEANLTTRLKLSDSYRAQWGTGLSVLGFERQNDEFLMELKLP